MAVNGETVRELGTKAEWTDRIEIDGEPIQLPKRFRYIILHKPAGVVTTRQDPQQRKTVYDYLYPEDAGLHPVGRLDIDTSGLLILTNDGDLTYRLTHPKYEIEREYIARTHPAPTRKLLRQLRQGAELEDGPAVPKSADIHTPETFRLILAEGRNREVRRLFEALEMEVLDLHRSRYGPVQVGRLKPGKARPLNPDEINRIRQAVQLT